MSGPTYLFKDTYESLTNLSQAMSNIEYNHIYTHDSNQMYMIKSNGGSGTVENLALNNFMGHSNAYTLDFDTEWSSMSVSDGDGITYSNISFSTWTGTATDGTERGPVKMNCPEAVPCTDITVEDFNVWTDSDASSVLYVCENAYGTGACLAEGDSGAAYTSTSTVTSVGDYTYTTMANELATGYDVSSSIPIPTMPASFYPGLEPISAVLNGAASAAASATGKSNAAVTASAVVSGGGSASTAAVPASGASGSSASYSAPSETSAPDAQPTSGGWGGSSWGSGSSGFWGNGKVEVEEPATTPAPGGWKRSAKFRKD